MGGGAEIVNQLHESLWPNFPKLDVLLGGLFALGRVPYPYPMVKTLAYTVNNPEA